MLSYRKSKSQNLICINLDTYRKQSASRGVSGNPIESKFSDAN